MSLALGVGEREEEEKTVFLSNLTLSCLPPFLPLFLSASLLLFNWEKRRGEEEDHQGSKQII